MPPLHLNALKVERRGRRADLKSSCLPARAWLQWAARPCPAPLYIFFPRPLTILHLLAKAGAPPHANLLFAKSESGQQEEGGRRHVKGVPFFSLPPPPSLLAAVHA